MSQNAGESGGVAGSQPMSTTYTGVQINFGDLSPYLTMVQLNGGLSLVQVGSFNYDNSKMVFNDEFIADETKIRSVLDYSIKVSVVE